MATIQAASKSRVRISQVKETTRGTTPSNPAWRVMPHLDQSALNQTQTFERSNEVKSNRMGGKQVGGNIEAGGNLALPMKEDAGVRDILQSLFSTTFSQKSFDGSGGNPQGYAFDTIGTKASATIQIASGNVSEDDNVTVNGVVFTFKASPVAATDIDIGVDEDTTAANLQAALDASTNSLLTVADYTVSTDTVTITYGTVGTAGNSFTLATNDATDLTLSNATLVGGVAGQDQITRSTGSFINDGWNAGEQIVVTNATTSGNNIAQSGLVTVSSVTATSLVLSSNADLSADEAFGVSTQCASLAYYGIAGSDRHYFTHEVAYLDLDPVVYEYFRGNEANTGTITIPTSGEVTAEISLIGNSGEITETVLALGSGSRTDSSDNTPYAGSVAGSALNRSGVSSPEVESLTVNINNNRASKFAVGQQYAALVEEGDFEAELSMSLYFADKTVQDQYLAGTRTDLEVTVADQDSGHKMILEFPEVVFTTGDKSVSGQTVVQNVTAYAEEDGTHNTKCRVWVIPAAVAS